MKFNGYINTNENTKFYSSNSYFYLFLFIFSIVLNQKVIGCLKITEQNKHELTTTFIKNQDKMHILKENKSNPNSIHNTNSNSNNFNVNVNGININPKTNLDKSIEKLVNLIDNYEKLNINFRVTNNDTNSNNNSSIIIANNETMVK
jgi:hypothetical protein